MNFRATLAELVGTFTLTFIGAGAGALAGGNGAGIVGVALAHGVVLMTIVYAFGAVSGAHVNPAVTLAAVLAGRADWAKAVGYWVAQFAGAAIAAFLLAWFIGGSHEATGLGATVGSLTPYAGQTAAGASALKVIALEAILTGLLVISIYGTAMTGRNGNAVGIAIGFTLTSDILMGGALTGASMNPARTFGPALATGHLGDYFWMYLVGPCLGAVLAVFLCRALMTEEGK